MDQQREALRRAAGPRRRLAPAGLAPALLPRAMRGLAGLRLLRHAMPTPRRPPSRHKLLVGSVELRPCSSVAAYCGELDRPLDPTGAIPGHISIHFEYYPHTGPGKAVGTLVATEGGPGYPATQSRDDYLALFKPLRRQRDVLLMDNRGTGQSGSHRLPRAADRREMDRGIDRRLRPISRRRARRSTARPTRRTIWRRFSRRSTSAGSICTAIRTAPTSNKYSRCGTRISCAPSCSTAPIR